MPGLLLPLGIVVVVIMPLALGVITSSRRRLTAARRAVDQRPITPIAALRDGESARIRGIVAAREPLLTSAIGGQPCVGYRATIGEFRGDWVAPILSREAWPSFLVTDETGTVVVQGQLELLIGPSDGGVNLPPRAWELLKEDDVRMKDLWFSREFSFQETVLKVGDPVNVVGRTSRATGAAGGSVMRGTYEEPVVVSDDLGPVGALPARTVAGPPLQIAAPQVRGPSRREIERQATSAIAALREGEPAKIQGAAAAREPLLTSPVSGRTCIGYRVIIERIGHGSHPVVRREAWPSFLITDDTGTAAVQGPFSIRLDADDGGWATLPPGVYSLLEEAGVPTTDILGGDADFRFRETLLEPGDRVVVVGRPALEIDPAGRGTFREPPRLYVLRGSDEEPVAVLDDDAPAASP